MYNARMKNEYIKNNISRNNSLTQNATILFNRSELYENTYKKDLYDFSIKEILDMYKGFYTTSLESLMVANSQYKIYTSYYLNQGLVKDNQNHFEEVSYELLMSCLNIEGTMRRVVTRKELYKQLEQLNNPSDKFLVLALFEGLGNKLFDDIHNLKLSSFNNNVVTLKSGREFQVSNKLVDYAYESADEYTYYTFTGKEFYYAEDDDHIIKRLYNAEETDDPIKNRKRIYSKLVRIKDYLNAPYINQAALTESGRIDYVLFNEDGTNINIETKLLTDKDLIDRYGRIMSYARYMMKFGEYYNRD